MVIYDVQEKLQLFKKPLGDFNDGPKGNRLPDPLFNAALVNVLASTFFTDFYQLLLLRVAVSPIGELRSIVIVVLCCVSKCGSLNFYVKWGQL